MWEIIQQVGQRVFIQGREWVVIDYFSGLCVCVCAWMLQLIGLWQRFGIWNQRCEKWATKIGLGKWSIGTAFGHRNASMSPPNNVCVCVCVCALGLRVVNYCEPLGLVDRGI